MSAAVAAGCLPLSTMSACLPARLPACLLCAGPAPRALVAAAAGAVCREMQEREGRLSDELAQAQANLELLRRVHQASQNQLFRSVPWCAALAIVCGCVCLQLFWGAQHHLAAPLAARSQRPFSLELPLLVADCLVAGSPCLPPVLPCPCLQHAEQERAGGCGASE